MTRISAVAFAAALLVGAISGTAEAQGIAEAPKVGAMARPCSALPPIPSEAAAFLASLAQGNAPGAPRPEALAAYQAWQAKVQENDFAGLCHYDEANAKLPPASGRRVVFFGDSITELWGRTDPSMFAGDAVNRGISGQTTAQMVGRFQEDVIALHPRVVHILAGTNDIAGNTGPTSLSWVEANIRTMAELAKANHIQVVLAAVLPAARYSWRPQIEAPDNIAALNAWMGAYAKAQGLGYVDYGPVLDDGHRGIKPNLSLDGVHPTAAGYAVMRPLAEAAVRQALGKGR
jgi:lysophospholipase L1-like esterase